MARKLSIRHKAGGTSYPILYNTSESESSLPQDLNETTPPPIPNKKQPPSPPHRHRMSMTCSPQRAIPTLIRRTITSPTAGTSQPQEIQTDCSNGFETFLPANPVDQYQMPKYNKDSYSITGKKVCLVVVISKFDLSEHDRNYTENDYAQADTVLKRRGFEVILLVGRVTKTCFIKKLLEIRKRTDIGLFMLVVSSHGDENDNVMFSDNSSWNNGKPRYVTYS